MVFQEGSAGAAFGTFGFFAGVAGAAFFLAELADGLWVGGGPVPGQQRFVVGFAGEQLFEDVADVSPDVEGLVNIFVSAVSLNTYLIYRLIRSSNMIAKWFKAAFQ